jgi:hypothetical protein
MTTATQAKNSIVSPFQRGARVLIPAGTIVQSMNPAHGRFRVAKRTTTITVHMTFDGWIDVFDDYRHGVGYLRLPTITYPGSGGYWQDVQVTEDLCTANGVPVPDIPVLTEDPWYRNYDFDLTPSYEVGHCDRWTLNPA